MNLLSPAQRREMKARAHSLHPVASIGSQGLTEAVLKEIEVALTAHELIKIRVHGDDRPQREAWMQQICQHTGAAPVQMIGKLLILWRERPAPAPAPTRPAAGKGSTASGATLHSAKAFAATARRKALAAASAAKRAAASPHKGRSGLKAGAVPRRPAAGRGRSG